MKDSTNIKQLVLIVDEASAETAQLIKVLGDYQIKAELMSDNEGAYSLCVQHPPALLICEVKQENIDGIALLQRLREHNLTKSLPVVITARVPELEERLKILHLDIDDFISKPYYPEEVAVRIDTILQELERHMGSFQREHGFTGNLEDMNLMDLIQTLELGGKSAIIHMVREPEEGHVYVLQGEVVDASLRDLGAEEALQNLMMWLHGHFDLNMITFQRPRQINKSTRDLLVSGSQRIHAYKERANQLPPMDSVLSRVGNVGMETLSDLERQIWALLSKPQPLRILISACRKDELRVLEAVQELLTRGVIVSQAGSANSPDLLTQNIMMRVSHAKEINKDPYSRIASFFKRSNGEKKKPSLMNEIPPVENRLTGPAAITHKIYLQRGDLLLIRQRLLSQ